MTLRLCLFGQAKLEIASGVQFLALDRLLCMLAYLACQKEPVKRSDLAMMLWDDGDTELGAQRLRQLLYRSSKKLGDLIETDHQHLSFRGTTDVADWQMLLVNNPRAALDLYRGEFLSGLVCDASEFSAWLTIERENRLQQFLHTSRRVAQSLEPPEALNMLEYALSHAPLEHDLLLTALSIAQGFAPERGQSLVALHLRALAELGETPIPEIQKAIEHAQRPSLPISPVRLSDSTLIGREAELEQVQGWLEQPESRVLSLIGVGGIGKTSLAMAAVQNHAVAFVPLAGFVGQSLVPSVAAALGAVLSGQGNADLELRAWLERRPARVLLLDNVEQCLDATRQFIEQVLPDSWRVLLTSRFKLALRQEQILELHGLSLPQSANDFACASATLFLQAARRHSRFVLASADAAVLVRLCHVLVGTPLALELAAAWTRALSLPEILAEVQHNLDFLEGGLERLPAQQHGLRAVFNHSYVLLNPSQQTALASLAIFRGGFDKKAAQQITNINHRNLLTLSDSSLVIRDAQTNRYHLHELIRQYAEEHLQRNPEQWQKVAQQHAAYYLQLAQQTPAHQLHLEADNLRAVLTWSLAGHETSQALELIVAMRLYWFGYGLVQEALGWLAAALEPVNSTALGVEALLLHTELLQTQGQSQTAKTQLQLASLYAKPSPELAALCQTMQARLAHRESQYQQAIGHCYSALELAPIGSSAQAQALRWLGRAEIFQGDLSEATTHIEQALRIFRNQNDFEAIAHCQNSLGLIGIQCEDYTVARACFHEALRLAQAQHDLHNQAANHTSIGWLEYIAGQANQATYHTQKSLEMHRELGNMWETLNGYLNLGHIAFHEPQNAMRHYQHVLLEAGSINAISLQLEALLGMAQHQAPEIAVQYLAAAIVHPQSNNEIRHFAAPLEKKLRQSLGADFEKQYQKGVQRGLEATLLWAKGSNEFDITHSHFF